jgi:hypothetical protein
MHLETVLLGVGRDFLVFKYFIQHCFICRPSGSTVSEDAGIEPRLFIFFDFGIGILLREKEGVKAQKHVYSHRG